MSNPKTQIQTLHLDNKPTTNQLLPRQPQQQTITWIFLLDEHSSVRCSDFYRYIYLFF